MLDADYVRPFGDTRLTLRASYDRFSYSGTYPLAVEPDGTPTLVGQTAGLGARAGARAPASPSRCVSVRR